MVRNRENSRHYTWGADCDGWHLVESTEFSLIQERMPGGASESPHLHERSRQVFFVLHGRLEIDVAGRRLALAEHDALEVAPGSIHTVRNPTAQEAVFLVVSVPASHGDRIER